MDSLPAHRGLERALAAWVDGGRAEPLERWLGRELDGEGVPRRADIAEAWAFLRLLTEARDGQSGWPRRLDGGVLGLTRFLLRFTRGDGTPLRLAEGVPAAAEARLLLGRVGRDHPGTREARVIAWMLGRPEPHSLPPPLPAWGSPRQALAVLREDWKKAGDLLAVDQRLRSPAARLELIGGGVPWLGPEWRLAASAGAVSSVKPVLWKSSPSADVFEWTYRAGGCRHIRTAVVLRGRRLALLGEQFNLGAEAAAEQEVCLELAPGVHAARLDGARGVRLSVEGVRAGVQVLPVGLPALPYETERGRFEASESDRVLRLTTAPKGRRGWLPILVSWDPSRHRKRLSWRQLTITQDGRICPPETACAVRVSWGRAETLVLYRSLGPPARRAFLGHQTSARFLIGRFTTEGVVEKLLAVEE